MDLTFSLQYGLDGLVSKFCNTVNDHKPDGAVAFRPLHSGSKFSLGGVASWVSRTLSRRISVFRHILTSSLDARVKIESLTLPANFVFFHFDLDDFLCHVRQGITLRTVPSWSIAILNQRCVQPWSFCYLISL